MKILKEKKSSLKKKSNAEILKENEDKFSDDDCEKVYDTGKMNKKLDSYKVNLNIGDKNDSDTDPSNLDVRIDIQEKEKPKPKAVNQFSLEEASDEENKGGIFDSDKENHQEESKSGKSDSDQSIESSENKDKVEDFIIPELKTIEDAVDYFEQLRRDFKQKENDNILNVMSDQNDLWKDHEFFSEDVEYFYRDGEKPKKLEELNIEWSRIDNATDQGAEQQKLEFFYPDSSNNTQFKFKIKRGIMNDKFFIGAVMMLFKAKEEFFTNLVIDYENVNENIKYGFCGFQFFINGEWRPVVIDTYIPWHQGDEMTLSGTSASKTSWWLTLLEKAYSKVFKSYDVLNDVSIKNILVDLTGGISKKVSFSFSEMNDTEKKHMFEEMKRCVSQNYLMGCMKFTEILEDDLDDTHSDKDEEEDIVENSMYVVLDIQEADGYRLVYLNSSWDKGKWSKAFSPEDETWETNKGLKEKLGYDSITDGTFWMTFEDWLQHFDTLYYCRIFPQNWSQFCIPGLWNGNTSGGAPYSITKDYENKKDDVSSKKEISKKGSIFPIGQSHSKEFSASLKQDTFGFGAKQKTLQSLQDSSPAKSIMKSPNKRDKSNTNQQFNLLNLTNKMKEPNTSAISKSKVELKHREIIKRVILPDSDDRWFLNPQYKLEIKPLSKVIISLLQEDHKLEGASEYKKCNFIILLSSGRYSRVWDIKEENVIKKAIEYSDESIEPNREILVNLDYFEILRKLAIKRKKKVITKHENVYINIIPYLEYTKKFEIEKSGQGRTFKPLFEESKYWLRIFSSDDIMVFQLPKPFEKSIDYKWDDKSYGGSRFTPESRHGKLIENPYWPLNPQFLMKFDSNVSMKIVIRKTNGYIPNEESKIGMILTKPNLQDLSSVNIKNLKATGNYKKNDQILRVLESTNKILESKKIDYESINRKLTINNSEWVVESEYSSKFVSSLFANFNRIDSPVLIIPTLENHKDVYDFKLSGK